MTVIGRMKIDHPALGTAGGAALHTSVETMLTKLADMPNARFFTATIANAAFADFDHNFKTSFDDLRFDLYTVLAGELTEVLPTTGYTIAATPGFLTTKIRVTNSTGSSKDVALIVIQDPINLDELIDVAIASPLDGQVMVYNSATLKWENQIPAETVGGKLKLWETFE